MHSIHARCFGAMRCNLFLRMRSKLHASQYGANPRVYTRVVLARCDAIAVLDHFGLVIKADNSILDPVCPGPQPPGGVSRSHAFLGAWLTG